MEGQRWETWAEAGGGRMGGSGGCTGSEAGSWEGPQLARVRAGEEGGGGDQGLSPLLAEDQGSFPCHSHCHFSP